MMTRAERAEGMLDLVVRENTALQEQRTARLAALRAFHLDLSEVTIGADLDYQVKRLAELIERYG